MLNAQKVAKKKINGANYKIGIVVSQFNDNITGPMLEGALETLEENQVKKENIETIWVPGSFEIPLACQKLAQTKKYDALVAIGCVIKGETDHFYYICNEASRGVMDVMLKYNLPIGFGVLTTQNSKQAEVRSRGQENKGREAAEAALAMTGMK
jgi:6,7-dimethyl-8-ribityllumazine synthase